MYKSTCTSDSCYSLECTFLNTILVGNLCPSSIQAKEKVPFLKTFFSVIYDLVRDINQLFCGIRGWEFLFSFFEASKTEKTKKWLKTRKTVFADFAKRSLFVRFCCRLRTMNWTKKIRSCFSSMLLKFSFIKTITHHYT